MKIYFAMTHEGTLHLCKSEKAAFKRAEKALRKCIQNADDQGDEEPTGIDNIAYGRVYGFACEVYDGEEPGYAILESEELDNLLPGQQQDEQDEQDEQDDKQELN